jgi:hypothetical protein
MNWKRPGLAPGGRAARELGYLERPVIVAMIAMRVVQVAVNEIVGVIAMWHRLMSASWPVHVPGFVAAACMARRAAAGIFRRNLYAVLLHAAAVHMMKVAAVQVVDVVPMAHRGVAAARFVTMRMVVMFAA